MGADAPSVVSISLGPDWLLAEKNSSDYSGTFELMRDHIIPKIEIELGSIEGRRIVFGESMGGFNGLQMALKTAYFTKAAVICSPIPFGVTPFSTLEEVNEVILASTAYAYYGESKRSIIDGHVSEMIFLAKQVFPTLEDWAGGDILTLASNLDKAKPPVDFYLAAGFYDPYVLYEGNAELAKRLSSQGLNVEWRPQWGGHCAVDIPSLARFLVQ
jgi:enterochelin esterase-like enzyme